MSLTSYWILSHAKARLQITTTATDCWQVGLVTACLLYPFQWAVFVESGAALSAKREHLKYGNKYISCRTCRKRFNRVKVK